MEKLIKSLLLLFVLVPILAVINSLTLYQMWQWFITPAFGIATPKLYLIYGLFLIACFLKSDLTKEESNRKNSIDLLAATVGRAGAFLLIGWVVQFLFK